MPLKLNVKPGERLFVAGGTIEIASEGTIVVVLNGQVVIVRETDYLHQSAATTARRQIVWALQEAYIHGDTKSYREALSVAMSQAGTALRGKAVDAWTELSVRILEGEVYKALKAARKFVLLAEGFADWPSLIAAAAADEETQAA